MSIVLRVPIYGMDTCEDLFTPRQALALTTLATSTGKLAKSQTENAHDGFAVAVQTCLALMVDKQADTLISRLHGTHLREKHRGILLHDKHSLWFGILRSQLVLSEQLATG